MAYGKKCPGHYLGSLGCSYGLVVPKGHQGDAWRMIVDLSYPGGLSVNDKISFGLCSLWYPSMDNAVSFILALGLHTQLVKIDLKDAYRILPIHPDDRHLLGISWEDHLYVDLCLPLGFRSVPKIFTAFADVLAWVLHHCGVGHLIHYLDDFLIFGLLSQVKHAWLFALLWMSWQIFRFQSPCLS